MCVIHSSLSARPMAFVRVSQMEKGGEGHMFSSILIDCTNREGSLVLC